MQNPGYSTLAADPCYVTSTSILVIIIMIFYIIFIILLIYIIFIIFLIVLYYYLTSAADPCYIYFDSRPSLRSCKLNSQMGDRLIP